MKRRATILSLLCLALGACATAPHGASMTPAAPPAAVPASAPIATPSGEPAAVSASLGERDLLLKRARASGYKTRQKDGATVYCRDETPVGTHFSQVTCLSEEQTVTAMRNAAQTQDYVRSATGRCAGSTCLNN